MQIGNGKIAGIALLQGEPVPNGADIISDGQIAARLNGGIDGFFFHIPNYNISGNKMQELSEKTQPFTHLLQKILREKEQKNSQKFFSKTY